MSVIEKKIADLVLKRVRQMRSLEEEDRTPGSTVKAAKKVTVREARFSDCQQVGALNSKLGLGPDSPENWKRLWLDNPAIGDGEKAVIGWVLVASEEIVGFLGSIPMLYEFEGLTLRAAATCRLAVEPDYRAFTHLLVTSFFRQKVDLFLDTTATVSAGKIMMAFKAVELPQKDYGNVLFWILDPGYFTKSVFKRLGINSPLNGIGSALASIAVRADMGIRRRPRSAKSERYTIAETSVNQLGDEFQQFWSEKSHALSRLRAKRTSSIMRWHFDPPGSRKVTKVLGCYVGSRLVGYAVVQHDDQANDGLRRSIIADLMIDDPAPQVMDHLLAAILKSAKEAGSHVLEVMGFPKEIRQKFLQWKPYSRNYPSCPYLYKARDPVLHQKLANENAWYACPFDGDATLWP
jgi:hypothetical protein